MNIALVIILYLGFISLGLPDQILGVAWPDMRQEFHLPLDFAGILVVTTSLCTTISSFLSGHMTKRFSVWSVLVLSAALTGFAMVLYGLSPTWLLVILITIPLGLGAGAVDSVLNDYVAKNLSSRHMNWLHGFWGLGATLGPALMTLGITVSKSWRPGYIFIGLIQLLLLILFLFTKKLWDNSAAEVPKEHLKVSLLAPKPLLSVLFFFVYTALEGAIGVWFFSVLVEDRGIEKHIAGTLITVYWASLTIGRFIMGYFSKKLDCSKIISTSLSFSILGISLLFIENTTATLFALIITGLSFAAIYPCMMFETSNRFGHREASVLTGYQVGFACLGYALVIPFMGVILDKTSLDTFVFMLLFMGVLLVVFDRLLGKLIGKDGQARRTSR